MSYYQFPAVNKLKVIDAPGEHIGAFQVAVNQELIHLTLGVYVAGVPSSNMKMRLKIYGATRYDSPFAVSEWVEFNSDSGLYAGDWIGNVRFDFDNVPLDSDLTYQMRLETSGYTRNGVVHYIAAVCDYGSSVSNRISGNDVAVYMTVAGAH
jgi:hypothetical protein